ncbi:MAG TPA: rod-binding protein [Propylenella sp.]|nr:rod-binding protein [Propylenella sp.]
MAINPPSDIILDVLRAADPLRARSAAERLTVQTTASASGPGTFEEIFADVEPDLDVGVPFDADASVVRLRNLDALAAAPLSSNRGTGGPFERFEAFVLQNFIEAILPAQSETIFGKGNTGEIWKSLLAEKLADQLARAGGIGIADRIMDAHAPASGETVPAQGRSA